MTQPSTLDDLLALMPFARLAGVELLEARPDLVVGRVAWDESRCTAGGILHGGLLMALADTCGGVCAYLNLPSPEHRTATTQSGTHFLRAVRSGNVTASSRPLSAGARLIVVETELADDDGGLVAKTSQTQAVLPPG